MMGFFFLFFTLSFVGCKNQETETYSSKNALFFPKISGTYGKDDYKRGIDTAYVSFTHHPGKDRYVVPFRISLIGNLTKDTEYKLMVVDTLSSALPEDYELPEKLIFREGMPHDTLFVTLKKTANLDGKEVTLCLRLVENDHFTLGHYDRLQVKVRFNNIISKPGWWTTDIELGFFGPYSYEKYNAFILSSGLITIEGLNATEIRKLALNLKLYIAENELTEKDGSPMIIPIY